MFGYCLSFKGKAMCRGLVRQLVKYVKENEPKGFHSVCLMCAKGKEGFFEKLGFKQRPHKSKGAGTEMELEIK